MKFTEALECMNEARGSEEGRKAYTSKAATKGRQEENIQRQSKNLF